MPITRISNEVKLKIFLISFILSLPFWWGINVLAGSLEKFWLWQEIIKNPQILNAEMSRGILEKKIKSLEIERLRAERLQNLDIDAKAVISVEVDRQGNEKILLERNPEESLAIASLTKLMTAFVVFDLKETYNPSQIITITENPSIGTNGAEEEKLEVGDKLSVGNLLNITLIESNNGAALALSEPVGHEAFVALMNLYAKNLSMENTRFINPTGLDYRNESNMSTALDLIKLAENIIKKYPQIFEISSQKSFQAVKFNSKNIEEDIFIENTNELLREVPNIYGGKTGQTPISSGCLLLVVKNPKDNNFTLNIVLGSEDRFGDMKQLLRAIGLY